MTFAKPLWAFLALATAPLAVLADPPRVGGASRWATFQDASDRYFALSLQADPTGDYPSAKAYEVVILADTSASQTGPVRFEGLEVVDELVASLPAGARVGLLACDVDTVDLGEGLMEPTEARWETAVARLKKRIPLGTTDLGKAFQTAASKFSASEAQRTIVYVGDGINRMHFLSSAEQRELIDSLVSQKITCSSFAIGPIVDLPTLAVFANQTGGILLSRDQIEESTQAIGRHLAQSATLPVMWIESSKLPAAVAQHFPQRFPPLRIDRDTVIVGRSPTEHAQASGEVELTLAVAGQSVNLVWEVAAEASSPDLGFLAAVTEAAERDGGLTLPALGSSGLRAMSFMLADSATAMVKSGQFALKAGQVESALRIAEEALKSDPNNAEAISLLNAAKSLADREEAVPAGKFMQYGPATGAPEVISSQYDNSSLLDETLGAGDLLSVEQQMRGAAAQALAAEVREKLREAGEQARRNPTGVKNSLKLLLEELDNGVEDIALRAQLQGQVKSAIEAVAQIEAEFIDRIQQAEMIRAQADQAQRLLAETSRRDDSLKQLVEQFNFLIDRQQYVEASKDVAPEISDLAPNSALANVTREESSLLSNYALVREAFEAREQGFVDVMRAVEQAAVPFAGDPPIVYPAPEVWQALSAQRKERYGAINLAGGNDSEQRIYSALKQEMDNIDFTGLPLQQVMQGFADDLAIPIFINQVELDLLGVDPDSPVTLSLPPISLRSALRLILEPLELTYIIRNEVLEITSQDSADADPINKVYPVGDLVVPPMPMGGGMMGGGMMGGMGGMGGGMMGGMGGGMGGMFVVPDDASKSPSDSAAKPPIATQRTASGSNIGPRVDAWIEQLKTADDEAKSALDAEVLKVVRSKIAMAEAYLEAKDEVSAVGEFEQVIRIVSDLMAAGYPQPWMYQALSLGMEACQYPADDIKRVLLSGLDFQGDSTQAFDIAKYLAKKGLRREALEMLHDLAVIEPYRYDVFELALPLAEELQDVDALRWVCVGILSKAWPDSASALFEKARLLARATSIRLSQEGRVIEAKVFDEELKSAMLRDMVVRVTWTGNADLDIRVQEPAGTICSLSNPQTISGGVLVGDTSSSSEKASVDGYSEYYVCSQGYAGQYDVLVRRVWGDASGGKATIEIYTDFGTPEQSYFVKQLDLSEKDAIVQVEVKNGHRKEPIAEAHLAQVRGKQFETQLAVLGQIAGSSSSDDSSDDFRRMLAIANARRGFGFPVGGGVVGYRPVITTLQEGASLFVTGVVSADRRYVRISPSPNFTGIGEVFTFNSADGSQGQNQGGGGGFGGGGLGQAGGGIGGAGF